jgi:putative SOS response-associated peptidase YedK
MCGRFVSHVDAALEREFQLGRSDWQPDWANYNVSPSQTIPAVRLQGEQPEGVLLRWGLVPFWCKGEPPKFSTINARVETLAKAASYRAPWRRQQRCLIPADGYYEWRQEGGKKQPYYFRLAGGESFAFCGLWDRSVASEDNTIESCTVITVPANAMVTEIHHKARMPAILNIDDAMQWLHADHAQAMGMLATFPADGMDRYAVSQKVNAPRHNDATLIEPLNDLFS